MPKQSHWPREALSCASRLRYDAEDLLKAADIPSLRMERTLDPGQAYAWEYGNLPISRGAMSPRQKGLFLQNAIDYLKDLVISRERILSSQPQPISQWDSLRWRRAITRKHLSGAKSQLQLESVTQEVSMMQLAPGERITPILKAAGFICQRRYLDVLHSRLFSELANRTVLAPLSALQLCCVNDRWKMMRCACDNAIRACCAKS